MEKLFWTTSNKGSHQGNIKPVKGDKLRHYDGEVAEELNWFFKNSVSILDINGNSNIINPNSIKIKDTIEKVISMNFAPAFH